LYPFGFGLSYTGFWYRSLKTSARSLSAEGTIDINVVVKNFGKRAGDEVVQLYVRHLDSAVSRPRQELKAFSRVHLRSQEEKAVTLSLPASRLAYWDAEADRWTVEKNRIEIIVGPSSADGRLRKTIRVH
jgi:beta-glucosidase